MVDVSPADLQSVLWRVYMLRILLCFLNVLYSVCYSTESDPSPFLFK